MENTCDNGALSMQNTSWHNLNKEMTFYCSLEWSQPISPGANLSQCRLCVGR